MSQSQQPHDGAIWLIGCGNMAGAMLSRWLATGIDPTRITVIRPSGKAVADGVRVLTVLPDEPAPAILMLGFKPHQLGDLAGPLAAASTGAAVVSILAGVSSKTLHQRFPAAGAIVRALPNLPVALGKGVVAMFGDRNPMVESLMAPLGLVEWIVDEARFDAVTALAGSGPAFAYRFIDALAQAGAAVGLPADQAQRLALATVEGAALLAGKSDSSPAALAERVASKGGSTRKGLDVLDEGNALVRLLTETLAATEARNAEMGAASKTG
ncbi:pyrroline-5-carboxylate reductase [soil metagenome]